MNDTTGELSILAEMPQSSSDPSPDLFPPPSKHSQPGSLSDNPLTSKQLGLLRGPQPPKRPEIIDVEDLLKESKIESTPPFIDEPQSKYVELSKELLIKPDNPPELRIQMANRVLDHLSLSIPPEFSSGNLKERYQLYAENSRLVFTLLQVSADLPESDRLIFLDKLMKQAGSSSYRKLIMGRILDMFDDE